jgi:hypothetical protein
MPTGAYDRNKRTIPSCHPDRKHKGHGLCVPWYKREALSIQALIIVGKGCIECTNCGCNNIRILEINHLNGGRG